MHRVFLQNMCDFCTHSTFWGRNIIESAALSHHLSGFLTLPDTEYCQCVSTCHRLNRQQQSSCQKHCQSQTRRIVWPTAHLYYVLANGKGYWRIFDISWARQSETRQSLENFRARMLRTFCACLHPIELSVCDGRICALCRGNRKVCKQNTNHP